MFQDPTLGLLVLNQYTPVARAQLDCWKGLYKTPPLGVRTYLYWYYQANGCHQDITELVLFLTSLSYYRIIHENFGNAPALCCITICCNIQLFPLLHEIEGNFTEENYVPSKSYRILKYNYTLHYAREFKSRFPENKFKNISLHLF